MEWQGATGVGGRVAEGSWKEQLEAAWEKEQLLGSWELKRLEALNGGSRAGRSWHWE